MNPKLILLGQTDSRGRPLFRLAQDYEYVLGPGATITVPEGYITNFGTIPRWFAWWVSPVQLANAAIVHDWMCNEHFCESIPHNDSGYSRWLADAVLYEAMARQGFGWLKRATVFAAVRAYAIFTGDTRWPPEPKELKIDEK
jgi:hypothetical protein